jgi:hypothetical protein
VKRGNESGLILLRCLLSPLTSWRALQIMRNGREGISFDAAWRRARLRRHPDEAPYLRHGHGGTASGLAPEREPSSDHPDTA